MALIDVDRHSFARSRTMSMVAIDPSYEVMKSEREGRREKRIGKELKGKAVL